MGGLEADLTIVDLDLPDGAGVDLIGELRGVAPDVPVVAITTSRDPERYARALQAGADEVLTTAVSGEEIIGAARRPSGG